MFPARYLAMLGISAAGSRSAHARKTPQVRISQGPPCFPLDTSLRSAFRLRAPAPLTPARRLKFESLRARHFSSLPLCRANSLLRGGGRKSTWDGSILMRSRSGLRVKRIAIEPAGRGVSKNQPQIRSAPDSLESWDARTALPQNCSSSRYVLGQNL
jgi:hypothetical protein